VKSPGTRRSAVGAASLPPILSLARTGPEALNNGMAKIVRLGFLGLFTHYSNIPTFQYLFHRCLIPRFDVFLPECIDAQPGPLPPDSKCVPRRGPNHPCFCNRWTYGRDGANLLN
jgi:hypothetical protein